VGGVAGEEHPPDPVARHLPFVAVEARHPARVAQPCVGAEGAAGDLAEFVEVHRGVVGKLAPPVPGNHAVPAVAERRHQREGVAGGVGGQHVGGRVVQAHVGQHHRADHGAAGEGQAERPAHRAADAVGADGIGGAPRPGGAVPGAHVDLDAVVVLAQPGHLGAVDDLGAERSGALGEQPLGVVLGRDQHEREPGRQPGQVELDPAERPQGAGGGAGGDQVVGQAARVQHLQRARVDAERAGEVRLVGAPLQHRAGDPGRGQVPGQQQPGRPGPDDQDGIGGIHHPYSATSPTDWQTHLGTILHTIRSSGVYN
jgi:hypothetical protein